MKKAMRKINFNKHRQFLKVINFLTLSLKVIHFYVITNENNQTHNSMGPKVSDNLYGILIIQS